MQQSIPSTPSPPANLPFLFLWMANPRGRGHLSCQLPGCGDKSRGQIPSPKSSTESVFRCEMRRRFLTQTFSKTGILLLYRMNQRRPFAKRDNSCTLKAPDPAIIEFEFNKITEIFSVITKKIL